MSMYGKTNTVLQSKIKLKLKKKNLFLWKKKEKQESYHGCILSKQHITVDLGYLDEVVFISFSTLHLLLSHSVVSSLCNPMDCSIPGFPVLYQLPELAQTHFHRVGDAIQPFNHLLSLFPPAFNLSQHQGPFQRVSSSHKEAKVLEFQLQHQSFQ